MQSIENVAPANKESQGSNYPTLSKFPRFGGKKTLFTFGAVLGVVLVGVLTGWLLSGKSQSSSSVLPGSGASVSQTEAGLKEEKGDTAEGTLEEGGIGGEGTHHLVRDGGPSKYVYLTSTVIDLQGFVGKKVKVWGETISARKAGWLMDVTKLRTIQ
jgi:hypothetical protein